MARDCSTSSELCPIRRPMCFALKHTIYTILLSCSVVIAQAQKLHSVVLVVEDSDQRGLHGAHVVWQSLDGTHSGSHLTDNSGTIELSFPGRYWTQAVVFQISHLGFETYVDTLVPEKFTSQNLNIPLQPSVFNLDEQVITGQYGPGSTDKAVHKVTVIGREKIDNMAAITLEDVLSNALNIRLSQDNILGSGLSMQGISGENVKIMIDGVPVIGRVDGNIDLSQINLNNVERIEIIEGPMSVNYGTNALAGTINIITQKSDVSKPSMGLSSYYENVGTHNLQLQGEAKLLNTNLRMSAGRNYFDGWSASDAYWPSYSKTLADSRRFKQWKPKEQYFGRFNASRTVKDWNLNYRFETFSENILNRGLPRAPYGEAAFDDVYYTSRIDHALSLDKNFAKHQLRFLAASNRYGRRKNTYIKDLTDLTQLLTSNPSDHDTSAFDQFMSRATWSSNLTQSSINYQLGYDLNYEQAKGRRIEGQTSSMGDYAIFGSLEWHLLKKLLLRPALRVAHNTVYEAPLSPSLNAKWAWKNNSFRASYARGFRAPSIKELHFLFVDINHNIIGNTDLVAERSNNYNLHFQHKKLLNKGLLKYEVSTYFNQIDNMITLAQINDLQYSYVNVGEFRSKGINTTLRWVSKRLNASISYNYLGRSNNVVHETIGAYNYSGETAANLQYHIPKYGLRFSGFYKYQGRLQNFALNSDGAVSETFIDPYHLTDVTLSKALLKDKVHITTGFKNLLNVQNVNASQSSGTHSSSSASISVGTGRTFFAQLSLNVR